ncbi:uncharacterized protein LOC142992763 [Genypterus blacodes]|uniref:uncharacterized protein LOC142992763 n=1 Tax=Genypterus blacodes TaxID=154954 RepID=UPI003F777D76
MSTDKATTPCNKFQANIFSKSKCQNCFKSRELHLFNDHDMEQAKPIYGGWLCLAPEGTDFDNPMQRSRKWQRRFFILYEHGSLTFALDELTSTLPQGTVNMNLCTEVVDAEPRTGQRNGLCIITPEQEIFIRGDNKEIINGWSEQLAVHPRTNKQNQKKKRKVEPVATQEPSPAKMAATDPCFTSMDRVADSGPSLWQEDQQGRGPDMTPFWTVTHTDPLGPEQSPAGYLCLISSDPSALDDSGAFSSSVSSLDLVADGNTESEPNDVQTSANTNNQLEEEEEEKASQHTAAERQPGLELTGSKEREGETTKSRKGRSEARTRKREKLQSCGDIAQLTAALPQRRSKSLDRRTSETVMIPDLLNFKKGWMVKLDEENQWKKYWFVLSTDCLRYYKDSTAEEASDLDGEIDLTKCYHVSEYQVQRNYGFQIHTKMDVYTLSAMTAGIRRNWIQALMKNVHPAHAPDVASLPVHHVPCGPPEALPKPDVTQDSSSAEVPADRDQCSKPRSVMERRREGRYKTFDWTEFRPVSKTALDPEGPQGTGGPTSFDFGDVERRKRREERRRRYESMLGISLASEVIRDTTADIGIEALSPRSQQKVEEDIEECWKQVERTVFSLEKTVPLYIKAENTVEMEELLDSYRNTVEDLEAQLAESDRHRRELEVQLSSSGYQQQLCSTLGPPLRSEVDLCPVGNNEKPFNGHTPSLNSLDKENTEILQQLTTDHRPATQEELARIPQHTPECQTPSIWLHDTEGNLQELGVLILQCPATINTPLLPPVFDSQHLLSESEGETTNLQSQPVVVHQQGSSPETHVNGSEYGSDSLIMDKPEGGDNESLNVCVEEHLPSDQPVVQKLSEEVELLTTQNEALNQRNQEMLNQLTEADREIESLKAELNSKYDDTNHLPEVEQLSQTSVEDLERDLSMSNQQLLEAQSVITSLETNLRDTEAMLLLRESTLQALGVPAEMEAVGQETKDACCCDKKAEGYLLRCFEATEAKLTELERQLVQSQATCRDLQAQNAELREAERRRSQRAAEVEVDMRRVNQELEKERLKDREKVESWNGCVSGEEKIQQVIKGMVVRLEAMGTFLEVIGRLDLGAIRTATECEREEVKPTAVSQIQWEEEFWSSLLTEVKGNPALLNVDKPTETLFKQVTERLMVEKQIMLLGHRICEAERAGVEGKMESDPLEEIDGGVESNAGVTASETKEEDDGMDFSEQLCDVDRSLKGYFTDITQVKMSLLNCFASSAHDKLQLMADRLCDVYVLEHPQACFIHTAATEALYCCHISRLHWKYQKELEETKGRLLTSSLTCRNCVDLMQENKELGNMVATVNQAEETDTELQEADVCITDDMETEKVNEKCTAEKEDESPDVCESKTLCGSVDTSVAEQRDVQEISDGNAEMSDASNMETDGDLQTEDAALLRRRVEELEEQLSLAADQMKEEFVGKMSSAQMQYGKEIEKLKAACECGFAAMEESHQKVVEELQRRHQQEVERLLVDRDRLLEEESAATATAIEAIRNAHQLELEREVQRRSQSENGTGNSDMVEIYRQHSEEVASCQRELEVLSQQFTLKCLENMHFAQALDAERKALCQCQQENQDLRTSNQELSGHLAAEITRLCSLAKQDVRPLGQGMDVYELEITLRVKESEVQCLKQEIKSLKDELQSAQRDTRSATKKYKDMFTELSIMRAKTERDLDELRANLRLAHLALGQIL